MGKVDIHQQYHQIYDKLQGLEGDVKLFNNSDHNDAVEVKNLTRKVAKKLLCHVKLSFWQKILKGIRGSWLHVCVNCKFYRPGMHNSCSVPNTEMVSDRENCNFCDEFKIMESQNQPSETPLSAADRFNSLFKD